MKNTWKLGSVFISKPETCLTSEKEHEDQEFQNKPIEKEAIRIL
jgi:hypothetical protein